MFEYKNADFYNAYCEQLEDFVLLEYFVEIDNKYVGKILAKNTIHKLEIIVRIPKTFPHNKLLFYTSSLYGYPHLIPSENGESWFCLNAAFAETVHDQLDEEFDRLRGWIKEQMRPELPANIADAETSRALAAFNTYSKGNQDEMDELNRTGTDLTFIGSYAQDVNTIERNGCFHCIKQHNGKYVMFGSLKEGNATLPFVIVDHYPKKWESFAALSEEFGWDNELCGNLLPDFHWGQIESEGRFRYKEFNLHTHEELVADRQYLSGELNKVNVPEKYKAVMAQNLESFVEFHDYRRHAYEEALGYDPEEAYYKNLYTFHEFALGVVNAGNVDWYLLSTQRASVSYEENSFDLGKFTYDTKRVVDISLYVSKANRIGYDDFYGRGHLTSHLIDKKILLIGTGAIGSFLAETLVRGGIHDITLSDGDTVEAGNLCRASFEMNAIGNNKAEALRGKLKSISPFCNVKTLGQLYGNINYDGQEKFLKELNQYDLILDCTASNELLHFLSYAVKDSVLLISICITNHAQDCLFISNKSGNAFEQRKHILAKIEQDTDNFYTEGTGCYAPTFLATASDMLPFTNLVVRKINKSLESSTPVMSTVWSYKEDTIDADALCTYKIANGAIRLIILRSVIDAIKHSMVFDDGGIGILMGGYSSDGTLVFVTHLINYSLLPNAMAKVQKVSEGILDYIGGACVSGLQNEYEIVLQEIAHDEGINTNNPLLAQLDKDGNVSFSLMIEDKLVPFVIQVNY